MKKFLLLTLTAILAATQSFSQTQLANSDFENWTTPVGGLTNPVGFNTFNNCLFGPCFLPVEKTTDAQSGNFAAKLKNLVFMGEVLPGMLINTDLRTGNGGQKFTGKPSFLKFYYKYHGMGGDTATVGALLVTDKGEYVGTAYSDIYENTDTWTEARVPFEYDLMEGSIDTLKFSVAAASNETPTEGSEILIDNISFEYTITEIESSYANEFAIGPNPTENIVTVNGPFPVSEINVYDMNGAVVAATKGNTVNIAALAPGLYNLKAVSTEGTVNRKIVRK